MPATRRNGRTEMMELPLEVVESFNIHRKLIKGELCFEPDGIHGSRHSERVLLHALYLADRLGVSDEVEKMVLIYAAAFHDIGRIMDGEDCMHGRLSWEKLERLGLRESIHLNEGSIEILRFIIENHCVEDCESLMLLEESDIKDKETCWRLYKIFKDSDGLDRVRIGVHMLDPNMLRFDISRELCGFAAQLADSIALDLSIYLPLNAAKCIRGECFKTQAG
jgi:hypothetical protein